MRKWWISLTAALAAVSAAGVISGALSGPARADASARPLTLVTVNPQFTSFTCLNASVRWRA